MVDYRLGEERYNNQGYLMKIIEYKAYNNVIVEFQDDYKYKTKTNYRAFLDGLIKNRYHKSLCNVGYLGENDTCLNGKVKQSYKKWFRMMERCYYKNYMNSKAYDDCYVCETWHNYSEFEAWHDNNYYECGKEMMCLDKDILRGEEKIYSPETCMYIPQKINNFFIGSNKEKSGASKYSHCDVYNVRISSKNGRVNLGNYKTVEEAHKVYKNFKEKMLKEIAKEYKTKYHDFPEHIYSTLCNYELHIFN
jgi:hypothetical protein